MKLDELMQRVPEPFRPVVAEYGPALITMSAEELWAWIQLLVKGRNDEAYRAVLAKMDGSAVLTEWDKLAESWQVANEANAQRLALQRSAVLAVLRVLLTAALAMVGL